VTSQGLCQCGCGVPTRIATKTDARDGIIRGAPMRFLKGHNHRGVRQPVGRWRPVVERFWSKVAKTATCWLWTGALEDSGYGYIGISPHYFQPAHRVAWALTYGPIPDGLSVLHSCDVNYPVGDITSRRCVNPAHLYLGTHADNMRHMAETGRRRAPHSRSTRSSA
jgi:hypothetical protein